MPPFDSRPEPRYDPEAAGRVPVIAAHSAGGSRTTAPKRRGRPLEMSPDQVLASIRRIAAENLGLFRIHQRHSALYARSRRLFGSWSAAVRTAGLDYAEILERARTRALEGRAQQRARRTR